MPREPARLVTCDCNPLWGDAHSVSCIRYRGAGPRVELLRSAVDKLRTVLGQTIEMRPDPSGRPCAHLGAERAEALAFAAEAMALTVPRG
jgi:hypothetical protein